MLEVIQPNAAVPKLLRSGGRKEKPLSEIITEGLLTIMPDLAHRIVLTGRFDRQRPLRGKHVEALATQMRQREWTAGTQIHFGRTPDAELHCVNGQHRMHAVIKAAISIEFQVLITDVANENELIKLYRRHDRLIAARTISDTLAAEGIPEAHGLRRDVAGAVFRAVAVISSEFRSVRRYADPYLARSDEARLRMASEWWQYAVTFQELTDSAPAVPVKTFLRGAGTMAVALMTVRYQPEIADIFWRGLAEDDALTRNDPRKAYLRYIYTSKGKSEVEAAKAAAQAWNKSYEGETLESVRVTDGPVKILGTPVGDKKRK